MKNKILIENIKIALRSIKNNLLRTILTVLIIALGITALTGILTAIDSIKNSLSENFMMMGANTFSITNRSSNVRMGGGEVIKYPVITYKQALKFKEIYDFPAYTSIFIHATHTSTLRYKSVKSNPNISIIGADENYMYTSGRNIAKGRNFSKQELINGNNLVIIGPEIEETLFENTNPLNKQLTIGSSQYTVIGVVESKGSSFGFNADKDCIIPLLNAKLNYMTSSSNYNINVMAMNPNQIDAAIGEATAKFRLLRDLSPSEDDNFNISKSDSLIETLMDNIKYITLAATIIGLITLLGASIGLMNIMLVAVAERTREIGVRKAIGAKSITIKRQFLIEAITITFFGGILGAFFGILVGNIISVVIGSSFIIPWAWVFLGIGISVLVGIISGIYPAIKASKLDPIDSLRYE